MGHSRKQHMRILERRAKRASELAHRASRINALVLDPRAAETFPAAAMPSVDHKSHRGK